MCDADAYAAVQQDAAASPVAPPKNAAVVMDSQAVLRTSRNFVAAVLVSLI
jgi:hypothetical protein